MCISSVNSKVLVLCAGEQSRWGNHLSVPKYLVPIQGEPLAMRTYRQMVNMGQNDVTFLVGDDSANVPAELPVLNISEHVNSAPENKFLSSWHLWNKTGLTVLLFGDVWLSDIAAREILVGHKSTIRFVGRLRGSSYTGCNWPEVFAVSFLPTEHIFIKETLNRLGSSTEKPMGWQLYETLLATTTAPDKPDVCFSHIDDFTEDFDFPADFDTWNNRIRAAQPIFSLPLKKRKQKNGTYKQRRRNLRISAVLLIFVAVALTLA